MTPDERAEAIRFCGFRESIEDADRMLAIGFAVLSLSLVGIGVFGLLFGEGAGERGRAAVMLIAGVPMCCWGWAFYRRPLAPADDADLARELRHRRALRNTDEGA